MIDNCIRFVEDMKLQSQVEKMIILPKGFNKASRKKLMELKNLLEKHFSENKFSSLEEVEI
jgi:hypothetical protein